MASNTRKRIFPKPPVRFHSGLEKTLGKNSNKGCYEASKLAIYNQEPKTQAVSRNQAKILYAMAKQSLIN